MRLGTRQVCDMVFVESIRMRVFSTRAYASIEREGAFLLGLPHETGKPVLAGAVSEIERANQGHPLGLGIVEIRMSQLGCIPRRPGKCRG